MSPRAWGRRDFLLLGGGALGLAAGEGVWGGGLAGVVQRGVLASRARSAAPSVRRRTVPRGTVRMGFVLPSGDAGRSSGMEAGILLGSEESEQVGALLGVELDVRVERVERGGRPEEVEAAGARLVAAGVQVLVGAVEPRASLELERTASRAGVIFVDALPFSVTPSARTDASSCVPPAFRVGMDHATGVGLVLEALAQEALAQEAQEARAQESPALGPPGGPTILVGDPGDPQLERARKTLARLGDDPRILDASTPAATLSDELGFEHERGAAASSRIVLVGPAALAWAFSPGAAETAHLVVATTPLEPEGPLPVTSVHAPALWHPGLVRFGAAQLNERHERRFGNPMDPSAWAGWFVVKLLWDLILREAGTASGEPVPESLGESRGESPGEALGERLMDPATRFDGHKGVGMGFRSDGRLRQPLYLVRTDPEGASEVVHEGPLAPQGTPFVAAFDALALPPWPPRPPCRSGGMAAHLPGVRGILLLLLLFLLPAPSLWGQSLSPPRSGAPLVFVTNEVSGDVTVIDSGTDQVVRTIRVGSRPRGIRVSPDGNTVSIALSGYAPEILTAMDAIVSVDVASGEILRRYDAGTDPETFDLSPDGRTLYISNEDAGTATVVDVATGEIMATLSVGVEPEGVAASPDGRWVYITAESSNTVAVIDTRTRTVVHAFLVDARPRSVAFAPDSRRAYVTNEIGGVLSVVDVEGGHQVIHTLDLAGGVSKPVGVVVSPDGSRVYVANGHAHSVSVIDAATLEELEQIPVGRRPWGIAVTPDGRKIYTANGLSNDVTVIDARTGEVLSTIRVGNKPWGVAIQP